jgi:selenide, water dikinase
VDELLGQLGTVTKDDRILVGTETSDDAGVFLNTDGSALVQTVDFFPPVVDDPYDYGRIVAANSLSDVYAMGAKPVAVLNVVAWPGGKLGVDILAQVLLGAGEKIREAGACLLGGHTMENSQVLYGLSVTGFAAPDAFVRNSTAKAGEALILTKPLGSGILSTAAKGKALPEDVLKRLVTMMARLNDSAGEVMVAMNAGACTDVTGFGFLGHLYEIAAGSGVGFDVDSAAVPIFPEALDFTAQGFFPGGSGRNRDYLAGQLEVAAGVDEHLVEVFVDAQTSGGLLFTVAPEKVPEALERLHAAGDTRAACVGRARPADGPLIRVT